MSKSADQLHFELEEANDQLQEMGRNAATLMRENETLTTLLTQDGPSLKAMVDTIKNMGREIDVLRERNDGLMAEKNEAIRASRNAARKVKT